MGITFSAKRYILQEENEKVSAEGDLDKKIPNSGRRCKRYY